MRTIDNHFEELWGQYSNNIRKYILSKVENKHDVEDILQEVFLKVYQNIDTIEEKLSVKSWIFTITKNKIIDYYRKKKDVIVTSDILAELVDENHVGNNEEDNCNKEVSEYIKDESLKIPKKYLDVYELYEKKHMKHKEIVNELNISLSTSKIRLMRARTFLKENLKENCNLKYDSYGNVTDCSYKKNVSNKCC